MGLKTLKHPDNNTRRKQAGAVVHGAWSHQYCLCSAAIHLCWTWGQSYHPQQPAASRTRLPALIFDFLFNFCITAETSAQLLEPEPICFHKTLGKRRKELLSSTICETEPNSFFYRFLKLDGTEFRKRTQTLWPHEIQNPKSRQAQSLLLYSVLYCKLVTGISFVFL